MAVCLLVYGVFYRDVGLYPPTTCSVQAVVAHVPHSGHSESPLQLPDAATGDQRGRPEETDA